MVPKLVYMKAESVPKFDVRMRLLGINRMSEDGVYMSSVPSFLRNVSVEFEAARSRSNFGDKVARYSMGWFVV